MLADCVAGKRGVRRIGWKRRYHVVAFKVNLSVR